MRDPKDIRTDGWQDGWTDWQGNQEWNDARSNDVPGDSPGKKKDIVSWVVIGICLLTISPVGVLLLLWKLYGRDQRRTETAPPLQPRQTVDTRINPPRRRAAPTGSAVREAMRTPSPKKSSTRRLKIFGVILALLGVAAIDMDFQSLMTALAFLVGGGAMFLKGVLTDQARKRYARYLPIIADREAVPVEELARAAGVSRKQVEKDLQEMVEQGFFGPGAYLHMELGYLFRSGEADRAWREKQPAAPTATPKEAEEGYSGILRNIRRANDAIADPVLSATIDQLEAVTAHIFQAVEADPKKADRIETFLNYYLPTTQKLLDSYAQFEAVGMEGENLSQAKARISSTMDLILKGFSRQLDALYQADAMDVDSDIRVMESMLRRDTRSVAEDFGLDTGNVQRKPE